MKTIPLPHGQTTIVDNKDYARLSGFVWTYSPLRLNGKVYQGYAKCHPKRRKGSLEMHRLLMPDRPGFVVDHINRNKLDNRRSNLRYLTVSESNRNIARCDNTTGFPGVIRSGKAWVASASFNGTRYYRRFPTAEQAASWRGNLIAEGQLGKLPTKPLLNPNNTSGVRNVSRLRNGSWKVSVQRKGKRIYLGQFRDYQQAVTCIQAYRK